MLMMYVCMYDGAGVSQRPAYPSSKKVKDWDKLEAELKKQVRLLSYLSSDQTVPFFVFFLLNCG